MSATEELRRMLDERGVKWWPMRNNGYYEDRDTEFVANGKKHTAHEWGDGFAVYNLTPEQAIAATLGRPTLNANLEQALSFMRIWISDDAHLGESELSAAFEKAEGLRKLDAIESAIAATLGRGECELVYGENDHGDDGWWCQSCGEWFAASFRHTGRNNIIEPSYCQHCGKAVKL